MATATATTTTTWHLVRVTPARALSYAVTPPTHGNSQDPVVLLSSALSAPLAVWDPVVPRLTAAGFKVLRYNAPGHGVSSVPPNLSSTTFDSMAEDVHALLSHLQIEKLYAWIGVSLGAATAIVFAAKYPGVVERLVPCGTLSRSPASAGTQDHFGARVAAARGAGSMSGLIESTLGRWFGRCWLDSHVQETERLRQVMQGRTIDGFETCCAALRSMSFDLHPLAARAGSHVGAALLLVGEKDVGLFQTMEELRRGIESGLKSTKGETATVSLKVVRNGGHLCFIDGFASFLDLITGFLARG